jgi:hemolysin D
MSMLHKLQGIAVLLSHYGTAFSRSWANRDKMGGNVFKQREAEFLPAALEIQERPVSPTIRLTAKVLILLILLMIVWSIFGHLDIVVNASGEIKPHNRTKEIASIEVGSVRALHVREGQVVKKGDLLIELDATSPDVEQEKAKINGADAQLQIARSRALIAAVNSLKQPRLAPLAGISAEQLREAQEHLDGQYRDFTAKLQLIEGSITHFSETLAPMTKRAADYKELAKNRDVSLHAALEKEQERADMEAQLINAKNQRASLIAETKRTAYDLQSEADRMMGQARQEVIRNAAHSRLLKLTSPIDGTVQQLTVNTIGGVVPGAQTLMKIVPKEDTIEVEAKLENKDIGFVKEGQRAAVKIAAYDSGKYGYINARVVHISSDAIKDEKQGLLYSAILALEKSTINVNGQAMPLAPGMTVTAEIKTGRRRVIEYFLSPLIQQKRESFHER